MMLEFIIFGSLVLLAYWFFTDKANRLDIYLAAIISFCWVFFSGLYGYRGSDYVVMGLNVFAFVAWTAGLVLVNKIYVYLFKEKYWMFVIFYIVVMVAIEFVGYNMWGIQLATHYAGIAGIEAMHMPWWGQLYYLTAGILFVKLSEAMKK